MKLISADATEPLTIHLATKHGKEAVPCDQHHCTIALAAKDMPDIIDAKIMRTYSWITFRNGLRLRYLNGAQARAILITTDEQALTIPAKGLTVELGVVPLSQTLAYMRANRDRWTRTQSRKKTPKYRRGPNELTRLGVR